MRIDYEMTESDLATLLEAMKPVPYMIIGGPPRSVQENANDARAAQGKRMSFDPMTVQPNGRGDRFFSAESSETEEERTARIAHEAEAKRVSDIADKTAQVARLNEEISALKGD